MSFTFQNPDIVTDVTTIKQTMITYLENYMPGGWQLAAGSLLDLVLEAVAIQHAQNADVLVTQLVSQFRYFGSLVNVPPIDAVPATSTATFTVQDTAGYTIPAASTSIGINDSSGVLQEFQLNADLIIPPGASSGSATVTAQTAGVGTNGLTGTAQLVSAPSYVTGATMTGAVGGVDAEADAVYLGRLVETLGTLTPIPVLGDNFAVLARSVAGIFRATGVNGLKPGPPYDTAAEATGQDKNVTVAVADVNGLSVGSTIRGNAQTYLQGLREANFKVWVVDPQYNQIDVTVHAFSWPGFNPATVQAGIAAALQSYLSPALFATDPTGNAARWANDPIVRASVLYQTIMDVPGVRYVDATSLLFGLHGGTLHATDFTMGPGSAIPALPTVGTLTITVTPTT